MSERDSLHEALERIGRFPGDLAAVLRGIDGTQLAATYAPGKWTVRQLVHHIADAALSIYIRIRLIATEENPDLKPYVQESWARLPDASKMAVADSLHIITGVHNRTAALLSNIDPALLGRTGNHPVRPWTTPEGKVTIEALAHHLARHGYHHLEHIRVALAR